jgi:hypothetical protein
MIHTRRCFESSSTKERPFLTFRRTIACARLTASARVRIRSSLSKVNNDLISDFKAKGASMFGWNYNSSAIGYFCANRIHINQHLTSVLSVEGIVLYFIKYVIYSVIWNNK